MSFTAFVHCGSSYCRFNFSVSHFKLKVKQLIYKVGEFLFLSWCEYQEQLWSQNHFFPLCSVLWNARKGLVQWGLRRLFSLFIQSQAADLSFCSLSPSCLIHFSSVTLEVFPFQESIQLLTAWIFLGGQHCCTGSSLSALFQDATALPVYLPLWFSQIIIQR